MSEYLNDNWHCTVSTSATNLADDHAFVRYNSRSNQLEITSKYESTGWVALLPYVNIAIPTNLKKTVDWAMKKIEEEKELEELAKNNATLADLFHTLNDTKKQIEMVKILIKAEINAE